MIPPTIENARYAGPLPDGKEARSAAPVPERLRSSVLAVSARIRAALVRGRRLACDLLAAVPREEAAAQLRRVADCGGMDENACGDCAVCLETRIVQLQDQLADKAQVLEAYARLKDQTARLETALSAEQGLRARAESAALEIVALRQQLEDLRSRLQVAEADWRRLAVPSRALSDALEVGGGLSTAGNIALGNLRRALGMVP